MTLQTPDKAQVLAAGYFSALIGMHCPGQQSLYLSQTASFREPVYPQDRLTVRGTVVQKSESISVITIKTEILRGDRVVIDGEAKVKVMEMEPKYGKMEENIQEHLKMTNCMEKELFTIPMVKNM